MKKIIDQIYMLMRRYGSEDRPSQQEMTGIVYDTLEVKGHSCVEAPTGIGKTYAYLIAAALWAIIHKTAVAISTATKGLQDQLISKDFQRIQKLIEEAYGTRPVAAILKGKNNYVSKNRFNDFVRYSLKTDPEDDAELKQLSDWIASTETGDLCEIDLPDFVPASLICVNNTSRDDDCFYLRALDRCKGAHIIVTNHHSVLARIRGKTTEDHTRIASFEDMNMRNVIFDEAHELEKIALDLFTKKVSIFEIKRNISTLVRFAEQNSIGTRIKLGQKKGMHVLKSDIASLWDMINEFRALQNGSRVVSVNGTSGHDGVIERLVLSSLRKVEKYIQTAANYSSNLLSAAKKKNIDARAVTESHNLLSETLDEVHHILRSRCELLLYYSDVRSYPSIIQVDKRTALILQSVWKLFDSLVFTSATLSLPAKITEDSWGYFMFGIGLSKNGTFKPRKHIYKSLPLPFEYDRVNLYVPPPNAPQPNVKAQRKEYVEYVRSMIADACNRDRTGGIMVLCTSYRDMKAFEKSINEMEMQDILGGRKLIIQQRGVPMKVLVSEFTDGPSGRLLLAAGGFWTGVDFPREQLTTLLITRLPFDVKDDPITLVRHMNLPRDQQRQSYIYITEPAALIRFRQGIGRLVRTKDDYGNLYIADSRMRGRRFETVVDKLIPIGNKHEFTL